MCGVYTVTAQDGFEQSFELDSVYLRSVNEITGPTYSLKINEISATNLSIIKDEAGEYDDWIELYNFGDDTINVNGLYISDDPENPQKFQITTDTLLAPQKYLIVWADQEPEQGPLHATFKLDGLGETVLITREDNELLDSVAYPVMPTNVTYGRLAGNFLNWNYFSAATPGTENGSSGTQGITEAATCNYLSGFYQDTIWVELTHPDTAVKITYTLNGKVPTASSTPYTKPLKLTQTTILRFRAFKTGKLPSNTKTNSFLFDGKSTLDVVSVVGNPNDLIATGGLFLTKQRGVEKGVHIDYFGDDKALKFQIDGGLQLHSPKSNPQVSFRLYARSDYGYESMNHQIFKDKNIDKFKRLILRNSGNDGTVLNKSLLIHFRDGLHQTLLNKMGYPEATSAYRPISVFINGRYWGVYNARERMDKYFIEANYGYTGEMDLLERAFSYPGNKNAIEGNYALYNKLDKFAKNNDLAIDSNFNYIADNIDLDSYMDYWIHEIYIGNFDWMSNNIKMYRPNQEGAQFKWLLWDTDHGSGLPYSNYGKPSWNTLTWSLSVDELRTENGRDNGFMRKLIENETFKNRFINRYADLLNSLYTYDHMQYTIDSITKYVENDMLLHQQRWSLSESKWRGGISYVKDYYIKRNNYVRKDIVDRFNLDEKYVVVLNTSNSSSGVVHINSIKPEFVANSWFGIYFKKVPFTITASPKAGYTFSHWNENTDDTLAVKTVDLVSDTIFLAHFKSIYNDSVFNVAINEIYQNDEKNDWIELYNKGNKSVGLNNWTLETSNSTFVFNDTVLAPNSYFVVGISNTEVEDEDDEAHDADDDKPAKKRSESGFSMVSNDVIELRNQKQDLIDFIDLGDGAQWPHLPNTYDFSLELISPNLDNEQAASWRSSVYLGGSPDTTNSLLPKHVSGIRINEVMASNNNVVYDEYYEYDDWIELYNTGNTAIDLRGLLVSDKIDNPVKYQVPCVTDSILLGAGGFTLLWADKESDQGPLHLNFKLPLEGESLYLYQNNGYDLIPIDALSFKQQYTNISYGATTDGSNEAWSYMAPTPLMSNNPVGIDEVEKQVLEVLLYPQPACGELFVQLPKESSDAGMRLQIFDMFGQHVQEVVSYQNPIKINTSTLSSGVYLLLIKNGNGLSVSEKFIKE